jgi:acyl-[acyl carrier protein]--UDP-N-acetylglucosamine O-acyltransferase
MYIISELTGKIYLNGIEIPLDDSTIEFQQYLIDKDIVGFELIESTPEEINQVNSLNKIELKRQQFEELSKTDWYITRFIETGIEIPEEILEERKQIRLKYE